MKGKRPAKKRTAAKAARPRADQGLVSFKLLFESNHQPMWVFDYETLDFIEINDAAQAIYGYTRSEFLKMKITEIRPPEEIPRLLALAAKPHYRFQRIEDWRHKTKDGRIINVQLIHHPMELAGRKAVLAIAHDVTEKKKVEEALKGAQERLRMVINNAPIILFALDRDGVVTLSEGMGLAAISLRPGETVGKSVFELYKNSPEVVANVKRALSGESFQTVTDLGTAVLETHFHPIKDGDGKVSGVIGVSTDVTERRRNEHTMSQQAAAMKASMDGMAVLDAEGRYVYLNDAHVKLYGFNDAGELIGRSWKTLYDKENLKRFENEIMPAFEKAGRWQGEAVGRKKDGALFPQEVSLSAIEGGGLVCVVRDITERRRAEEEVETLLTREQSARAQAEAASRAKDEFLAVISHELRTPMTAMLGWTWLLRSRKSEEGMLEKALDVIERNMRLQAQIIEDLLDVSSMITGKLKLEMSPMDLGAAIRAAIETLQPAIAMKGIQVNLHLGDFKDTIHGDPARIEQIFWNLLSNAVKFNQDGGLIDIRLKRIGGFAEVEIRDTGCGIEPSFLPYLFNRFFQAEDSMTREHRGLGLGLALVRHLVELHGGKILVRSDGAGKGSSFFVHLPIPIRELAHKRDGEKPKGNALEFSALPQLSGIKVLVVDDDPDMREVVRVILEHCSAQVKTASSAKEGYDAVQTWMPKVLISDISMPGEDGFSLIRRVRQLPPDKGGRIPAAALTAYTRIEDRSRALLEGFQLYLPKPIVPLELAAVVRRLAEEGSEAKI